MVALLVASNDLTVARLELISCLLGGCGEGWLARLGCPWRVGCGASTGEELLQAGRAAWKSRHGQREQVEGKGVAGEVGS